MVDFRLSGSPDRNTIISEEWPQLASSTEFVLQAGSLCYFRTGSDCWSSAFSCSSHRNSIILGEWPELASSTVFVLKVGALCDFRTGSEWWTSACPAHLTGTPSSRRNGPNWLPAPNSSCRLDACATAAPEVTVGLPPFAAHIIATPLSRGNGPNWLPAAISS